MKKTSKEIRERVKKMNEINRYIKDSVIVVETIIYPCEDISKIKEIFRKIVDDDNINIRNLDEYEKLAYIEKKGGDYINRLFHHFRQRRVLATVRRYLIKYINVDKGEINIFLHKQAAYTGIFSICEPGESPLGEVIIRIRIDNPIEVVKWLTQF